MMVKVLGPEEQPKSAIPMLFGVVVTKSSCMVSVVMCFTISDAFFCQKKKKIKNKEKQNKEIVKLISKRKSIPTPGETKGVHLK